MHDFFAIKSNGGIVKSGVNPKREAEMPLKKEPVLDPDLGKGILNMTSGGLPEPEADLSDLNELDLKLNSSLNAGYRRDVLDNPDGDPGCPTIRSR